MSYAITAVDLCMSFQSSQAFSRSQTLLVFVLDIYFSSWQKISFMCCMHFVLFLPPGLISSLFFNCLGSGLQDD